MLLGVLVVVVGQIWLVGRVFRVAILMTGKRPKFGVIWRWIRVE